MTWELGNIDLCIGTLNKMYELVWMTSLIEQSLFICFFSWLLKYLACDLLCSELLYADWVVFVPDALAESTGEGATTFLISEHLASILGDLV